VNSTVQRGSILAQNTVQAVPPLFLESLRADDAIGVVLRNRDRLRK
jgi:hypothetical protein